MANLFVWKVLFTSQVVLLGLSAISQLMGYAIEGAQKTFDITDISPGIFPSFPLSYLLKF